MKIRSAIDAYDRKQEPYVVAYLDVLGMTKRIKDSIEKQTESLNVIHNLFTYIYELSDPKTGIKKYSDIKFKAFSDNIIIAKRLSSQKLMIVELIFMIMRQIKNCHSEYFVLIILQMILSKLNLILTLKD